MSESLIETWRRIIINDLVIGLLGRSKRDQDAAELKIIHVEDKRGVVAQ